MFVNVNLEYFGLSIFILISFIISLILFFVSYLISFKRNDTEKLSAYECGFEPFSSGSSSFDVHFFIVGILFIIFDLELIFLYPWAIHLTNLGLAGFTSMLGFLIILTLGFVYEWNQGALDWAKSSYLVDNDDD